MDIRALRYFLAVVREENITRAAEMLFITQPTLSRQIQDLEKELDTQLIIRGKNRITLTDSGMLLRRRAEEIVELADKTEKEFLFKDETVSGTISIGCGEAMSVKTLSEVIADFSKEYPAVRFEFFTGAADHIKERLDHGLLDIGLLIEPIEIDKLQYIRFKQPEVWGAFMRSDDPLCQKDRISVEDINDRSLILPRRMGSQSVLRNWFGDEFEKLQIFSTINLGLSSVRLVAQGLAIVVAVQGSLDLLDKQDFKFIPLAPELTSSSVLVWKKYQPFGKAAEKFIEFAGHALKA